MQARALRSACAFARSYLSVTPFMPSDVVSCASAARHDTAACRSPRSVTTPKMIRAGSPFTPRGQATSKVSHPSGDCNGNFA